MSVAPPRDVVLELDGVATSFRTRRGTVEAISDVSFRLHRGETLAVVGESGSGKSVTALSILRLLGVSGRVTRGRVLFGGQDLAALPDGELREIRGRSIAMVFQDPATCLDPVYTVGDQIVEAILLHEEVSKPEARRRAVEMLTRVGIPDPAQRAASFPHQLSGGQRQRVMIAMALACRPSVLIADEPTTALDVTVQAQILELLRDVSEEFGTAMILVTHDLGVVAEMADRVLVMYAGRIVEEGTVHDVLVRPNHPYTVALMRTNPGGVADPTQRLHAIPGSVPNLFEMPQGCRFRPRCEFAFDRCGDEPPLLDLGAGRSSRCWLAEANASAGGVA
ncbi:MAG TPA: ABC transporter ATP-binding protein [Acidimicrobiales bacterium]|nr:ABC transporter ATP-binding protein [Acidimicrobiales bacterium]